jgi:hypothetical protein
MTISCSHGGEGVSLRILRRAPGLARWRALSVALSCWCGSESACLGRTASRGRSLAAGRKLRRYTSGRKGWVRAAEGSRDLVEPGLHADCGRTAREFVSTSRNRSAVEAEAPSSTIAATRTPSPSNHSESSAASESRRLSESARPTRFVASFYSIDPHHSFVPRHASPSRPLHARASIPAWTLQTAALVGNLGSNRSHGPVAEYRQAVEEPDDDGFDRDPGLLVWRRKDGRGGD